uniref:Immunoglobulin V-set domain-containing protein n=1 Tax=Sinocyclocheilus anshuiensis TaxID=1608454 RepID=A0A671PIM1_9TELE
MMRFNKPQMICVFGADAVESVSVMEGDSVTLHTDDTETQRDDEIEWRFGDTRIARVIRNITTYYNDERLRDRLKLDHQTGSLSITNTRTTDSGLYKPSTIMRNRESMKRFSVTVDVESVSVMEGDSIEWRFGDTRIARVIRNITAYYNDERLRDRLKLDHQTGSLSITNTRTTDSGLYKLSTITRNRDRILALYSFREKLSETFWVKITGVDLRNCKKDQIRSSHFTQAANNCKNSSCELKTFLRK